ncbi:GerAB/ArcD/ProY family transporter [Bacillus sp. CBEL-1]|uniref:GerAB/ArcD/ProY family transporter n=1 Tax=Bacillus sp. CBEL-1 TaxID=2502980 RepID=UPI0010442B60|nr:GerAB/ArcD/ProY family transporter [Bacillus sp. CBEL-1]TDB50255.1 spore gernimation protein [Bacillus sp. CBEL-1]
MKQQDQLLSNFYAIATISCTMLGVGLLTLPRSITEKTNNADGWIVLLVEWGLFSLIIILLAWMIKSFQIQSLYEFSKEVTGKFLGSIINLFAITYFTAVSSFEIRAMSEMIQFYLLESVPLGVIIITFMLTSLYTLTGGMNTISKMMALFFPFTIIILLALYGFSVNMVSISNLRPVLADGIHPILNAFTTVSVSFVGAELILFLPKYLKNKKQIRKIALIGFGIPLALYIITYILVVGALTVPEVKTIVYPTIAFVQSHEVKGIFVERLELFLLTVWLLQFFLTFQMFNFLAFSGITMMLKKNSTKKSAMIRVTLAVIIVVGSLLPKTAGDVIAFADLLGWGFLIVFLAVPLFLGPIMLIKKRVKKI